MPLFSALSHWERKRLRAVPLRVMASACLKRPHAAYEAHMCFLFLPAPPPYPWTRRPGWNEVRNAAQNGPPRVQARRCATPGGRGTGRPHPACEARGLWRYVPWHLCPFVSPLSVRVCPCPSVSLWRSAALRHVPAFQAVPRQLPRSGQDGHGSPAADGLAKKKEVFS